MTPSTTSGVTGARASAPPVSMDHCCVKPLAFDVLISSRGEKRVLWRSKLCDDQSPDIPPCARLGTTNQVPMPARLKAVTIVQKGNVVRLMTILLAGRFYRS